MKNRYSLTLFVILLCAFNVSAQFGEIRGFVYDKDNSEPLIYTSVFLSGTTYGGQTNLDGFFNISKVPPGKYLLMVTSIGYDTLRTDIEITSGAIITKKLYINQSAIEMKEVVISAETEAKKSDVRVSVNKITPKEIKQVPTIGGEPDLAQFLQVVPGVIFSGDQGGQLYIRGGTPIQNKLLLDGMVIYNPFHSIGLYSVLDADIIRGADIYTGGFNAEYGDRISSIMDITTRDGNKNRLSGKIAANPFTSKILLEGPLKKETEGAEGSSSFIVSGKTSYLDKTSKSLYPYADSLGLPYTFTDLYGKISMNSSSGSKFNVFGFHYLDDVDYFHVAKLGWKSTGIGSNFVLLPGGSSTLIDGNFAYSNYNVNLKQSDGLNRSSTISGFNLGLNFNYFLGKNEFKYGIEMLGFKTNFEYNNAIGTKFEQTENTTEFAAYLKYKKVWSKVVIEPGLRLNYYSSLSEFSLEPRIGAKYNITEKLRFKLAAGMYSQNLVAAASDRDVVNLFYGFLSGSDNLPKEFKGEPVDSRLQTAEHLIAGFEIDLPFHLTMNIEGYFKNFSQLENLNRDKIFADDELHSNKPDIQKKDFIVEVGEAKGVDLTLKYEHKKIYLWVVYGLGYVTRDDGVREYEPNFDRRHNVNIVGSYKFGNKDSWQANVRWNFGSPFPFTQSQGYYEIPQISGGIGSNINSQNSQIGTYYGDLNKGRLSYFHRLDISIQKTFQFTKRSSLEITAGASNVYDRENIFYVDRLSGNKVYQLPVIPTLAASFNF
ncbi:MAG: TonB-dependent receptor [Bacteroidetes bacterium]|nr:TonB-dependent receptor [Bacteroidota bacterium]